MRSRRVEILALAGCPGEEAAHALVRRVLSELGLEAEVTSVRVEADAAELLRFLGSPTIRVDGTDVEPGAEERTDYALACRLRRSASGLANLPDEAWVRAALRAGGQESR